MGRRDDIKVQQRAFTLFQVKASQIEEQSLTSKSNLHTWNNKKSLAKGFYHISSQNFTNGRSKVQRMAFTIFQVKSSQMEEQSLAEGFFKFQVETSISTGWTTVTLGR